MPSLCNQGKTTATIDNPFEDVNIGNTASRTAAKPTTNQITNPRVCTPRNGHQNSHQGAPKSNSKSNHKSNFTIVCDTREKIPYTFPYKAVSHNSQPSKSTSTDTVTATLETGDYSVLGYEASIAIERKSFEDFLQSITWGRDRFFREVKRLADMRHRAIIVEAEYYDVLRKNYEREISNRSVIATIHVIQARFGVPVMFLGTRIAAQMWALEFLHAAWEAMRDSSQRNIE